MILTVKNKMMLGVDKLLQDAEFKGAIPDILTFNPQEAADFLREMRDLPELREKYITVKDNNNTIMEMRFLLNKGLLKPRLAELIKQWYEREMVITYKGLEIRVNKLIHDHMMPNEQTPIELTVTNVDKTFCNKCGSKLQRKWLFWFKECIQPDCENYNGK